MAVCWEEPMTAAPFSGTHFSQHSHPERRTCHDVSFIPPVWHQAWICYDITLRLRVSYCLLFFISSPPVDLSLGLAVSGFVCVCLSCVFICLTPHSSERNAIVMNALVIKAMRGNHPSHQQTFKTILGIHTETQSLLHMMDYSGAKTQP